MAPIISVVGKSDSGKTSLLTDLVAELRQRGFRVAVVKHATEEIELDTPGKDTWRFAGAGAAASAILSAGNLAVFTKLEREDDPRAVTPFLGADLDLILTEGFKKGPHPKIEVHRREQGPELLSPPGELLAVVTDEPLPVSVPQFSRDEAHGIADLLVEKVLHAPGQSMVELSINGTPVKLDSAASDLLFRTLVALASGLRSPGEVESLEITVRKTVDSR